MAKVTNGISSKNKYDVLTNADLSYVIKRTSKTLYMKTNTDA